MIEELPSQFFEISIRGKKKRIKNTNDPRNYPEFKIRGGKRYERGETVHVLKESAQFEANYIRRWGNRATVVQVKKPNPATGRDWKETHDIEGYIGRTTGTIHSPILLYNRHSIGGGIILTANIVKIEYANRKDGGVLYQHPNYHKVTDSYRRRV